MSTIRSYRKRNNSYEADITVNGDDAEVVVTGVTDDTINWLCVMQFIEQ